MDEFLGALIEAFDARLVDEFPPLEADYAAPKGAVFCGHCGEVMFPVRNGPDFKMVCLLCRAIHR